jgi:hypothetical protein
MIGLLDVVARRRCFGAAARACWVVLIAAAAPLGCGGGRAGSTPGRLVADASPATSDDGAAMEPPPPPDGGPGLDTGADGAVTASFDCRDIFAADVVRTYSIDISPDEWNAIDAEFHNLAALQIGNDFAVYHPVTFRLEGEPPVSASVKLHGQWSWYESALLDGARAKMQFAVSFDEVDPKAAFHGYGKLVFDMPPTDWTFLHDRLAHTWLRQIGTMASCTASARLNINGSFYGLFTLEETAGHRLVKQFFPHNSDGDLFKAGLEPKTNAATFSSARRDAFWKATDVASIAAIVDLPGSVMTWAAEALLDDADGYYGGTHNFLIYDQGASGYLYLPQDTDATFDWMGLFDWPEYDDHPIFWWSPRRPPAPTPGRHWLEVMADPTWRSRYTDALAAQLARWDVPQIQGWIDTWSKQIAAHVAGDPHARATVSDFNRAIAMARDVVEKRPGYLHTFIDCQRGGGPGDDKDHDGVKWCDDCDDANAAVHPGAQEICGNGVDDNCNGVVDECGP